MLFKFYFVCQNHFAQRNKWRDEIKHTPKILAAPFALWLSGGAYESERIAVRAGSRSLTCMLHGSMLASIINIQDIWGAGRILTARHHLTYERFKTAAALYVELWPLR